MPLRLKQLELHGYKTFATKSEFAFSEGISAIVGPNGSGKCVTGDTLVTLADGRDVPIRALVEAALAGAQRVQTLDDGTLTTENPNGVEIWSLDPDSLRLRPRPVAGFVKREAPAELVRVRTRSGRVVTATPYHPLFTLDSGELKPVRADELKPGLRLALPRQLPITGSRVNLALAGVVKQFEQGDGVFVPNSPAIQAWAASPVLA